CTTWGCSVPKWVSDICTIVVMSGRLSSDGRIANERDSGIRSAWNVRGSAFQAQDTHIPCRCAKQKSPAPHYRPCIADNASTYGTMLGLQYRAYACWAFIDFYLPSKPTAVVELSRT